MIVTVQLHTILQIKTPQGMVRKLDVEISPGSSIVELLDKLEINLNPESLLMVINGRLVDRQAVLQPGDRVDLMPAISGGTV